jgi:hypothetical protein
MMPGLIVRLVPVVLALLLTACATAPPACPCLYGRPAPAEYLARCGA